MVKTCVFLTLWQLQSPQTPCLQFVIEMCVSLKPTCCGLHTKKHHLQPGRCSVLWQRPPPKIVVATTSSTGLQQLPKISSLGELGSGEWKRWTTAYLRWLRAVVLICKLETKQDSSVLQEDENENCQKIQKDQRTCPSLLLHLLNLSPMLQWHSFANWLAICHALYPRNIGCSIYSHLLCAIANSLNPQSLDKRIHEGWNTTSWPKAGEPNRLIHRNIMQHLCFFPATGCKHPVHLPTRPFWSAHLSLVLYIANTGFATHAAAHQPLRKMQRQGTTLVTRAHVFPTLRPEDSLRKGTNTPGDSRSVSQVWQIFRVQSRSEHQECPSQPSGKQTAPEFETYQSREFRKLSQNCLQHTLSNIMSSIFIKKMELMGSTKAARSELKDNIRHPTTLSAPATNVQQVLTMPLEALQRHLCPSEIPAPEVSISTRPHAGRLALLC